MKGTFPTHWAPIFACCALWFSCLECTPPAYAQRLPRGLDSLLAAQAPAIDYRYNAFTERLLGVLQVPNAGGWLVCTQRVERGLWLGCYSPEGSLRWESLLAPATLGMPAPLRDVPQRIFVEHNPEAQTWEVLCPSLEAHTYYIDCHLVRVSVDGSTGQVVAQARATLPRCRGLAAAQATPQGLRLACVRQDSLPTCLLWAWGAQGPTPELPTTSLPPIAPLRLAPGSEWGVWAAPQLDSLKALLPNEPRMYTHAARGWAGLGTPAITGRYYARALSYNGKPILKGLFVAAPYGVAAVPLDSLRPAARRPKRRRGQAPNPSQAGQPATGASLPRQLGSAPWLLPTPGTECVLIKGESTRGYRLAPSLGWRCLGYARVVPLYTTGPHFAASLQVLPAYAVHCPTSPDAPQPSTHLARLATALHNWAYRHATRADRYLAPLVPTPGAFVWVHESVSTGRVRVWVQQ
jgi:hypothetical protein